MKSVAIAIEWLISLCFIYFAPLFQNPSIPLLFSARRVMVLLALYYTGLLPFVPLREQCLETIMPSILLEWVKDSNCGTFSLAVTNTPTIGRRAINAGCCNSPTVCS